MFNYFILKIYCCASSERHLIQKLLDLKVGLCFVQIWDLEVFLIHFLFLYFFCISLLFVNMRAPVHIMFVKFTKWTFSTPSLLEYSNIYSINIDRLKIVNLSIYPSIQKYVPTYLSICTLLFSYLSIFLIIYLPTYTNLPPQNTQLNLYFAIY